MNWSIRARLTLWNTVVNASIIMVLGAIVYFALAKALLQGVDAVLVFEYRETVERLEKLGSDDELGGVPEAFLEEFLLRVSDPTGRVRMESPSLHGIVWQPPVAESTGQEPALVTTVMGSSGEQRMIFGRAGGSHAGWTVQIATSLADYRREMTELRNILMILFPISLLIASVAGYGLAGRALSPVEKITTTAQRISATNLSERIKSDRPDDELGRLAGTLNAMVERLAESLEATRRFTADASHEFMTPLAQIRTEVEVALQTERSAEEYSHVLRSVIEEVERLTRLAGQLLALAKEDALAVEPLLEDCPLESIVRAAVAASAVSASEAGVTLSLGVVEAVTLSIDPDRLRQVLDNLLQNAIRYNRPGGRVEVNLQASDRHVTISIVDTGVGIPLEALPHIFDRFYRVDLARSRRAGGTGLGLSIANTLIKKMRGRIDVESVVGEGSTFRVVLPSGTL
jgi:heavy metal sensor kinase